MNKKLLFAGALLMGSLFSINNLHAQEFVWAHNMGGTGGDYGRAVAVDAAGNVYTAGFFTGTADFDPGAGVANLVSAGANDVFIQKLDAAGNFLWARNIGGTGQDYGYTMAVDAAGNVYTAGRFEGTADFDPGTGTFNLTSAGGADMFIQKMDASGNFIWARNMGGTGTEQINRIATDAAGNVYATGLFSVTADFDPGTAVYNLTPAGMEDAFIVRLNANGDFAWAHALGGTGNDRGYSVAVDQAGDVLVTGVFSGTVDFDPGAGTTNLTSAGNFDAFIWKLSNTGNLIWARNSGGTSLDFGWDITTDSSNNVYATGYFQGTSDFDPGAGVFNLTSNGNYDLFIQKLTPAGDFTWARSMGGTGDDRGYAIAVDHLGGVYTSGYFFSTVDFDPGTGTTNLTSAGAADFYVVKLNSAGDFDWARAMGGVNNDFALDMAIHSSGGIYTAGNFEGPADFNPDPVATHTLTPSGISDVFVLKLYQCFQTSSSITAMACDTYTGPGGTQTWTTSGIYTDIIPNANGCDSVITIDLTINHGSVSSITASACSSYTSPSGATTWTSSGTYTDVIPNAAGCDSTITIALTILPATTSSIIASACDSYPSPSGNYIYTASGIYTDTVQNATGCDSVITINLTVNPIVNHQTSASICQGDSIMLGGAYQTMPGTFTDLFTSSFGCDSVVVTTLIVTQINANVAMVGNTIAAVQSGATYQWFDCDNQQIIAGANGQSFTPTVSGNYAVAITQNNCSETSVCTNITIIGAPGDLSLAQLQLYPNPAVSELTVNFGNVQQSGTAVLFSAEGKQLLTHVFAETNSTQIGLRQIPAGVYFLRIQTNDGSVVRKVVVEPGK